MSDYMDQPHEQQKHPDVMRFIEEVSQGDQAIANAMWSFWCFAHVFDDLVDESKMEGHKKELAFKALHDFVQDLLLNPFVLRHASSLLGMFTMAMTRCLDGDEMEKSLVAEERALAPAVRCGDVDVLMHFAYLARGWMGLRKFSPMRKYDICMAQVTPEQH